MLYPSRRCIYSSALCPTSPWNSKNLAWFRLSAGVVIGGEALNFPLSKAKNFFGSFCEERKPILLPFRPLLVPEASFLEILLLIALLLFPWWK
ncbi:hypothetical protein Tco_0246934 [Tanacetum coccineum]